MCNAYVRFFRSAVDAAKEKLRRPAPPPSPPPPKQVISKPSPPPTEETRKARDALKRLRAAERAKNVDAAGRAVAEIDVILAATSGRQHDLLEAEVNAVRLSMKDWQSVEADLREAHDDAERLEAALKRAQRLGYGSKTAALKHGRRRLRQLLGATDPSPEQKSSDEEDDQDDDRFIRQLGGNRSSQAAVPSAQSAAQSAARSASGGGGKQKKQKGGKRGGKRR